MKNILNKFSYFLSCTSVSIFFKNKSVNQLCTNKYSNYKYVFLCQLRVREPDDRDESRRGRVGLGRVPENFEIPDEIELLCSAV